MKTDRVKDVLENIARRDVREGFDLWPQIAINAKKELQMRSLRVRSIAAAIMIVLLLLAVFNKPVTAAIREWLGYVYVPQANTFLPADSTLMIKQPVKQEHMDRFVLVQQGVSTPTETSIWIEFSEAARPVDGAILQTPDGEKIDLASWEYAPNEKGSHGILLRFETLHTNISTTVLILPEGWQIPLEWVPASAVPGAVVSVPYPAATQAALNPCVENHEIQLCVAAATQSAGKTIVLVKGRSLGTQLTPGDVSRIDLLWQDPDNPIRLVDERGNQTPLETSQPAPSETPDVLSTQLIFPVSLEPGVSARLLIPGFYASLKLNQAVSVELGNDPQPGQIPVDADVQVLDQSVHFSKGSLMGDGTSSLRLYLDSDPVKTVDGIEPYWLEMGKPVQVNDLFGSGPLAGSKDLMVELIQSSGKVTGHLELPIVGATVIVHGPFKLNFQASQNTPATSTAASADANSFHPLPTSTPLSTEDYFYSGQGLQAGDLLYAVWEQDQTNVYRMNPSVPGQSSLFMTVPGNAYSFYIHQDRGGLNYLAGEYSSQTNSVDHARVYKIRFDEARPHSLPMPETRMDYPSWSYDGRFLAFHAAGETPGVFDQIGWIDLNCEQTGQCPVQYLNVPAEYGLSRPEFSLGSYVLAIDGVNTETGAGDIYLTRFDENGTPEPLRNLTSTNQFNDSWATWLDGDRLAWSCGTGDPVQATPSICLKDVSTGADPQVIFSYQDWYQFGISRQGNFFWMDTINRQAQDEMQFWLYPRDQAGKMVVSAPSFDNDYARPAFSADGQYLVLVSSTATLKDGQETLHVFSTSSKQEITAFPAPDPLGWLGWVR